MADSDSGGQISETAMATPGAGADSTPGTDDGIPPAQDTQHIAEGGPRDYGTANPDESTTTPGAGPAGAAVGDAATSTERPASH